MLCVTLLCYLVFVFLFKQKTAYEMRISDWSSDVCSSDLLAEAEWRAGHEDEADRAAGLAIEVADRQGSRHVLLQILTEFPAVASRRIDAEAETDRKSVV